MKPPPLLLGAALLFWGWRANMLWVGAMAGGLIESSHLIRGRWDFTDKEFNRLWDVCTVIFLAVAAYLRFSEDVTSGAYKFFEWMPLIFYLMALGCVFSVREAVPVKTFSWLLRRKSAQGAERADRVVAFTWIYLAICITASGATNATDIWFYVGSSALVGWALWSIRPRRIPAIAWCLLFLAIAGAAFYGQSRMQEVQAFFENKVSELLVKFGHREFDPSRSQTSMGKIGSLKQSSRIVMKVKAEHGTVPELLREGTYGQFDGGTWFGSGGRTFETVPVELDGTTWTFSSNAPASSAVRIIQRVNRKSALLAVPLGTSQLKELAAGSVETNRSLVIRAKDSPGLLNFVARFGPSPPESVSWDPRFNPIPDEELNALESVAEELQIDDLAPQERVKAIVRFFAEKFRYTTFQHSRELGLHSRSPLSRFLLETRAGHCEYFASATVLLLRYYKIPARYATGYAVQELAREEDAYLIRERHGHAWALANIDDHWVEVDSTPPDWAEAEASEFPEYEDLKDAWARFTFSFLEWRWLGDWSFFRLSAPWMVIPLTIFLIWRIFGRRMSREQPSPRETQLWPGADSEFFALERRLAKAGFARDNNETTDHWLNRITTDTPLVAEALRTVLRLHYKYRFAADGLEPGEREELRHQVRACLEKI